MTEVTLFGHRRRRQHRERSFTITVVDTTAPDVSVPASASYEATGPDGAPGLLHGTSAADLVDGSVPPRCDHDSGETFPIGDTEVTCSATDDAGNTGDDAFTITVVDTTAPDVSVPASASYEATGPDGAPVSFTTNATDLVDGERAHHVRPRSGRDVPAR